MDNEKTNVTIFSQKLAGELMVKGFVLAAMEPNRSGDGKNVFFFKNSPQIQVAIKDYQNRRKR